MATTSHPLALKVDKWIWGDEVIVWGYDPAHKYTVKIVEPKKGRPGCLSLQYHREKSETWIVLRGCVWGLLIIDGTVCTRLMRPGDIQNVDTGIIHRLMGVGDDAQVLEPSTPDRHSADKNIAKDVVRLHCVFGREVSKPRDAAEAQLVAQAVTVTEAAIQAIEAGKLPLELNTELLRGRGAYRIP